MYKRHTQGWWRHYDFLLLDEISLQVSFIIAVYLQHHNWAYSSALYTQVGIILILLDIVVFVQNDSMHNVLKRGYLVEAVETVKHCFFVFALVLIFVFAAKAGRS